MSSTLDKLTAKQLITPPGFLKSNVCYEVVMGSVAYGVAQDESDFDVYGFGIPPKHILFPHLVGHIPGFGRAPESFEQYQQHHVFDKDALGGVGREYDITIFSIVRFFDLLMANNPNVVDALFVPTNCILHINSIGERVRDHRRMFLHKGSYHRFRGYAHQQLHRMSGDRDRSKSKRAEMVKQYGFDLKFASHVIRLANECEQILETGDLDLRQTAEVQKAIRRGEFTEEQIKELFSQKEKYLEHLYATSSLPHSPPEDKIKELLVSCLEDHYGSLSEALSLPDRHYHALQEIKAVLDRLGVR